MLSGVDEELLERRVGDIAGAARERSRRRTHR